MMTLSLRRRRCYSLFAISISFIMHGSVQAETKGVGDATPEFHCIDLLTLRNMSVRTIKSTEMLLLDGKVQNKTMCRQADCCFYKTDQSLYCRHPRECEKLKKNDISCPVPVCMQRKRKETWTHWIVITIVLLSLLTTTFYTKYKASQKLKERENNVRKKLDMEFPPTMYGKGDKVKCQSDEDVCCICLDGLEGTIVRKLHCSHVLHQACFDKWCLHASDPTSSTRRKRLDQNTPEELLWACPFCKHPAMPDPEHARPTGQVTVAQQVQAGSCNPGVVSEDEQPEVIVEPMPGAEQAGPSEMVAVVEQGQSGSCNPGAISDDEQPEVLVEQQAGPTGMVTVVEQGQPGFCDPGAFSEGEQPEVIVEPLRQGEHSIQR